jgi:hypothetical protein
MSLIPRLARAGSVLTALPFSPTLPAAILRVPREQPVVSIQILSPRGVATAIRASPSSQRQPPVRNSTLGFPASL